MNSLLATKRIQIPSSFLDSSLFKMLSHENGFAAIFNIRSHYRFSKLSLRICIKPERKSVLLRQEKKQIFDFILFLSLLLVTMKQVVNSLPVNETFLPNLKSSDRKPMASRRMRQQTFVPIEIWRCSKIRMEFLEEFSDWNFDRITQFHQTAISHHSR